MQPHNDIVIKLNNLKMDIIRFTAVNEIMIILWGITIYILYSDIFGIMAKNIMFYITSAFSCMSLLMRMRLLLS